MWRNRRALVLLAVVGGSAGCGGGSREDAAADEDLTGRPSPFEQGQAQWPEEEKPYAEKAGERVAEKVAESGFST
jgi:hypothetical protein